MGRTKRNIFAVVLRVGEIGVVNVDVVVGKMKLKLGGAWKVDVGSSWMMSYAGNLIGLARVA